jgi:hypothetical protein
MRGLFLLAILLSFGKASAQACLGQFVEHELAHTTSLSPLPIRYADGNGSGLAIGELNNDGKLDIVLANLDGEEQILWNEGNLNFRYQTLDIISRTRGVIIVDMDGDGWNEILFTSGRSAPSLWRNNQDGNFEFSPMIGVNYPAYAMNVADLDLDGDLDFVAASYDAELEALDAGYLLRGGAGVYYYENSAGSYTATRLSERSQTLAVYFTDLTGDERLDILIGNDFSEPDRMWTYAGEWLEIEPFRSMSYNSMGFDAADIDNNQSLEIYETDWLPYGNDESTRQLWQPLLDEMRKIPRLPDEKQRLGNSLQVLGRQGYRNLANAWGVMATGWAWSAKFGDLDSDGFLDLYVVNGMIDPYILSHIPSGELREANLAFRNQNGENFALAQEWHLGSMASGRGMSMADLDGDADLDIVVNNLLEPAMLYENQLCGGQNLTVELRPQSIGARLLLHTSTGTYRRDIFASSGYLSGDSQIAHFGLPIESEILDLEILWPDGTISHHHQLNQHTIITKGQAHG